MARKQAKPTTMARPVAAQDPRAMATAAAQRRFDALLTSPDVDGDVLDVDLDFEAIEDALEAAFVKEHGQPLAADEGLILRIIRAREAGYLVGVQMGLRLRAAGGAR